MIANTWEWTCDWYQARHLEEKQKACCVPHNPRGGKRQDSYDPAQPRIKIPRKVLKGGSHLCAKNYCYRYRPAARYPHPVDTSTSTSVSAALSEGKRTSMISAPRSPRCIFTAFLLASRGGGGRGGVGGGFASKMLSAKATERGLEAFDLSGTALRHPFHPMRIMP